MSDLINLYYRIKSVGIYRRTAESALVRSLLKLIYYSEHKNETLFFQSWGSLISELSRCAAFDIDEALYSLLLSDENEFSLSCAAGEYSKPLFEAAKKEISAFSALSGLCAKELLNALGVSEKVSQGLVMWENNCRNFSGSSVKITENLCNYYRENGCGALAKYKAFIWRCHDLFPVSHPDPIRFSDLKGYETERGTVIANTLAFLDGKACNNVLLYGDRGTGKSSTVHALLNEFGGRGLRIIELPKSEITDFHLVISRLSRLPMRFIIFIDDLSFSDDSDSFSALKAALEGGIAARPDNMLVYATSNRRHLLKETFSSRDGDDLHKSDTLQQQLSLSDRFGLTVTFTNPDRKRFYDIIDAMAIDRGMEIDGEALHRQAEAWALGNGGRSPRTAKQFMDNLQSKMPK